MFKLKGTFAYIRYGIRKYFPSEHLGEDTATKWLFTAVSEQIQKQLQPEIRNFRKSTKTI